MSWWREFAREQNRQMDQERQARDLNYFNHLVAQVKELTERVEKLERRWTIAYDIKSVPIDPNPIPPFKPGLYAICSVEGGRVGWYMRGGDWDAIEYVRNDGAAGVWKQPVVLEVWDGGKCVWRAK